MCMCGKPTINGEPGAYSWDGKSHSTYQPNPPAMIDGDSLLYDEPGRCGGLDSHSHHFRIVQARYGGLHLLVRHGGGDERMPLGVCLPLAIKSLAALGSNARYWLFHGFFDLHRDATDQAASRSNATWREAAAEKRIKTRKVRAGVKVWVEPKIAAPVA